MKCDQSQECQERGKGKDSKIFQTFAVDNWIQIISVNNNHNEIDDDDHIDDEG